jgi:adenosylmethionine-8-amino-7-oxononanoate aminotransferase
MGSVFYRDPDQQYPVAASARGMYITDNQGKNYLDMSGGAAVSCLGHGHPAVLGAIHAQTDNLAFAHTAFFTNTPQEQLAAKLTAKFPETGARAYFTCGGSEANEAAINLAWRYWRAHGKDRKIKIISRRDSYHGNSFATLSLSGNLARRASMEGILFNWPRIAPCYAYRHQQQGESESEYALRAAKELEQTIQREGPDTIAAFVAETVVGASLGAVTAAKTYFRQIREICDRYNILLILDEVMCGTGRTGSFYAFEQEDIIPDITTLAKGIGGGYLPLAATIARAKIAETFTGTGKKNPHAHTYMGHANACAAGVAVLDVLDSENLINKVRREGPFLQNNLRDAFGDHPNVGDIRGRGFFQAIELVADKAGKTPLQNPPQIAARIKNIAMQYGLICYPGAGRVEDNLSAHILLAPPFIAEPIHFIELIEKLNTVMAEVFDD